MYDWFLTLPPPNPRSYVPAGDKALPKPVYLRAQRWGSSYVSNPLSDPFVADADLKDAACGDYCSGGAGVESAVTSGLAAADAVAAMLGVAVTPSRM